MGHPRNTRAAPETIRAAYCNFVQGLEYLNSLAPEGKQIHVPFCIQEALLDQIEELEVTRQLHEDMKTHSGN